MVHGTLESAMGRKQFSWHLVRSQCRRGWWWGEYMRTQLYWEILIHLQVQEKANR